MLLLLSDGAPDVRSLFRSSEPGGAWDPYDFSHQFQDSFGTIPVTAAGDPVGLTLDKSRGGLNNLGAELVPDPELNSVSTWVIDPLSWTASGGDLVGNNATNASQAFASTPEIIVPGRTYLIEFTVSAYSGSGGIRIDSRPTVGGTGAVTYATFAGVGTHRMILVNTSAVNTRIGFRIGGNAVPLSTTISRVSIREIPGVHRYQTASGSRKLLARIPEGGRRNLLTRTEDFSNAAWFKNGITATANKLIENPASSAHLVGLSSTVTVPTGTPITYSVEVKAAERSWAIVAFTGGSTTGRYVNLSTGAFGLAFSVAPDSQSIEDVGDGWWRVTITRTSSTLSAVDCRVYISTGDGVSSYLGDGASGILVRNAQFELGSSRTAYQRVGVNADCTEAGKRDCWGWLYDGLDDSDLTTSVDFATWTGTETRRNLLLDPESFGASSWIKNRQTVSENAAADDLGSVTADKLIETAVNDTHFCGQNVTVTIGQPYTLSVYAKAAERSFIAIGEGGGAARTATFNLSTGAVSNVGAAVSNPVATNMGGGWWRCSVTYTPTATTLTAAIGTRTSDGAFFETYLGDGTSGVLVAKAQLEPGSLTSFQRVGTDKLTVLAAVRKNSDAAFGVFAELTATSTTSPGSFLLAAPGNSGDVGYQVRSAGSVLAFGQMPNFPAPRTSVFTLLADIAGDILTGRIDGVVAVGPSSSDQGSGNYANAQLFFGRRNNASLPFSGYEFGSIVRGAATAEATVRSFERNWLAYRAGISF